MISAREQWLAHRALIPVGVWFRIYAMAESLGVGKTRFLHGIMYARAHGLIKERTIVGANYKRITEYMKEAAPTK